MSDIMLNDEVEKEEQRKMRAESSAATSKVTDDLESHRNEISLKRLELEPKVALMLDELNSE